MENVPGILQFQFNCVSFQGIFQEEEEPIEINSPCCLDSQTKTTSTGLSPNYVNCLCVCLSCKQMIIKKKNIPRDISDSVLDPIACIRR